MQSPGCLLSGPGITRSASGNTRRNQLPRPVFDVPVYWVKDTICLHASHIKNGKRVLPEMTQFVDFSLHGLFSIRLENPATEAVQAVKNQVGVDSSVIDDEPDLTVQYVDCLTKQMSHLVLGNSGFEGDHFYIVAGKGRKKYRVQFPFSELGQACKITCERGMTEIPLLNLIINLRMLAKGLMPIHASAFVYDGNGVVVNGWPSGGKTSTLFGFLTHGAQFVSDDWLFIDADSKVYGLMQPIKLSDWQLVQLPDYQAKVKRTKRWTIKGLRWLDAIERLVPETVREKFTPAKTFYRGVQFLNKSQRHVTMSPEKLFGKNPNAPTGKFDLLVMTLNHETPEVTISPMSIDKALESLMAALRYEWMQWELYYTQYLYAFPHKINNMMDTVWDKQRGFLKNILAGKQIYQVRHPHPVKLDELYQTINQTLSQQEKQ